MFRQWSIYFMSFLESLSARALAAPNSGISDIIDYANGRDNLIKLWVGEGDVPSPDFINQAAIEALSKGETFYTYQRGIPELRDALSRYYQRHFGAELSVENFYVTGSGMQAIVLAIQALTSPGDEMIYLAPTWPNIVASIEVAGVKAVPVELDFANGGWAFDIGRLEASITPKTKALFINTPSNPTGWTASKDDLTAILKLARHHGLWIVADEIYALYHYAKTRAPSFLDVMEEGDRIVFGNSFSKNWSMTGWRVGWLVAPPEIGQTIENLIQYSTSGVAQFMQRGAVVALDQGDQFIAQNYQRALSSRNILCDALLATNRVETLRPQGALYSFLKIDGVTDSRQCAFDIVDKVGVGLAPGSAFGPGGEGFLRACFLRDPKQMEDAAARLVAYISTL
jgi:aspartate/methionine/tyrosine aminotransferase